MATRDNSGQDQPPHQEGEQPDFRKAPTKHLFKQSGNPRGRPKGSKNRKTIVREIALEMHSVPGRRERRSTLQLALICIRIRALEGKSIRAFNEHHRLKKLHQPEIDLENVGYLVAPAEMSPEEWVEEQEKKNLTRKPPPGIEDKPDE